MIVAREISGVTDPGYRRLELKFHQVVPEVGVRKDLACAIDAQGIRLGGQRVDVYEHEPAYPRGSRQFGDRRGATVAGQLGQLA